MTATTLGIGVVVLVLGVGAVCALVLHKVRRIHLMMFAVKSDAEQTRREVEALYRQIESLEALNRLLALSTPLPPLRGWAGSPDFLLAIARHALRAKPRRMVECSSGASTIVLARCAQLSGCGHVFSLEHDPDYARQTRAELASRDLAAWATVVDAPLLPCPAVGGQAWYSLAGLSDGHAPVDMLVIDGPPQSTAPLARYPALPMLWPKLDPDCVAFLDDAARSDEAAAVRRWLQEFPSLRAVSIPCEKGCFRLSSSSTDVEDLR